MLGGAALAGSNFFVSGVLGMSGFGIGCDNLYDASAHTGYEWNKTIGKTIG